jgi:hypothetical protein
LEIQGDGFRNEFYRFFLSSIAHVLANNYIVTGRKFKKVFTPIITCGPDRTTFHKYRGKRKNNTLFIGDGTADLYCMGSMVKKKKG